MEDCRFFECGLGTVAVAREFVRSRLTAWCAEEAVDDAVLVTSELVTNAVLHARTVIQVRVSTGAGHHRVRLEISDNNSRPPTMAVPRLDATSGRGLPIVTALASSWGVVPTDAGKTVWAELPQ